MFSWDGDENNHMTTWTYLHSMKGIAKLDDIFDVFIYWVLVIVLFVFEMLVFELSFVLELFGEWTKIISEKSDEKYIGFLHIASS